MITIEYAGYLAILIIGFLIGLTAFQKQSAVQPVILLLGITFVSECLSRVLAYQIKNSNPPYHFLTPLQCILWGSFFYQSFKGLVAKRATAGACLLVAITSIALTLFISGIYVFPKYHLILTSFLFTTLGFLLFIQKLDEAAPKNVFYDAGFILSVSLIWFHLISFVFNAFHNFLLVHYMLGSTMRLINYISNYVFYILILYAVGLPHFHQNAVRKP